jgi:hypothetical protein
MYDPKHMDAEFLLVHEANDTPKESLRERNDEVIEHIYIGHRFKNDTVRVALRSKTTRKTLRAIYQNDHKACLIEEIEQSQTYCLGNKIESMV